MTRDEYERIENGEIVWTKNDPGDSVSWKKCNEDNLIFRFDGNPKEYYLFRDYENLSSQQKEIFDRENPFWADFFTGRSYHGSQDHK